MGDIRSSWEIAQEKADRLGDLSSEERISQKEEQYRNTASVLVHQYLDDKDFRPVKKELNKCTDKERDLMERVLLDGFINAIDLGRQETLELAIRGIKSLSGKEEEGHSIDAIKQLYDECLEVRKEEKQRVDDAGRQVLCDMGISGSAIGTINLYARNEWLDRLNSINVYFQKQMEGIKEEIVK